ncbi:MAG: ribosome-associated translation inhibitor RaiA [Candidatus Aureabacteria bacterium]|nr:ribosome-associated translation inhibitor RaiA [Candidatus Auribacterota bacterium]
MQLMVTGRHVNVTEAMKLYAREKLSRVMHERPHLNEVHLIMDVQKYRHLVEISARGKNLEVFCREETDDMYRSIDSAIAKLDRQLSKYKERHTRRQQKATASPTPSSEGERAKERYLALRVTMKPMFMSEALLQIKTEQHLFFVFLNAETEEVNFLYRSGDGEITYLSPKKIKGMDQPAQFHVRVFREDSIAPDAKPRGLRKKGCEVEWFSPEKALASMEAQGEKYRFFMNTAAENASVVYRQMNGTCAIIEPKQ